MVKDLKKGDSIWTPGGKATVLCVVKTNMPTGKCDLVSLPKSDLLLTPWHPVRLKGVWKFPADVSCITTQKCDAVYSFVLDSQHVMVINNVECVTLGHNFTENKVVAHPYFGSRKIVDDLKNCDGWQIGLIEFGGPSLTRDSETGLLGKVDGSLEIKV